ncbi:xanthine dehydrogenase family protein molybdopterin-binding subunit [Kribbella sp. NPDC050459]|uniref:xanthine dehydrogenase family protein molybdopterin-binding subunit n=1 Tax=Kribbella sp. NPDC050459 TaxID=3155785 RepID=UPI0033F143C4
MRDTGGERLIGRSIGRRGNDLLLTGSAQYVADLTFENEVSARVIRSNVAHGTIISIDAAAALASPGVLAVITAEDLPDVRIPIRLPLFESPEANQLLQPPLARGVVRYVGEPVAVVVAEDAYLAEDAAELVEVDIEDLGPVVTIQSALAADAPIIDAAYGRNTVSTIELGHGDADALFAQADVVVRETIAVHRSTAVPLETRGLIGEPDPDTGVLTMWGAAKVKHFTRQALAGMLGIDAGRLRMVEVAVGGGFGVRGEPYPEDFLVAFLALRLGRPVKWIEDRSEHFVATNHAREQVHELEIAATRDGRLLAFRDRAWCDHGGYVRSQGILPELLPALHIAGPYRWGAFAVTSTGVLTNKTPVGTFRGPGMTEATYVRERLLDRLAAQLDLDPAELRRRNLIPAAAMPFEFPLTPESTPVAPIRYESGDFPAGLEMLLERAGYGELKAERAARRARGQAVGIGLAVFVEVGGIGPFEEAVITTTSDGVVVHVGVGSLGQGVETALSQIAADALGIPIEAITIDLRDTDGVPQGFGAFASRSTVLAGNAIVLAAEDLLSQASAKLNASIDDLRIIDGSVSGPDGRTLALHSLGPARGRFDKPLPTFSFGGALCLVSVEIGTGRVRVLRHVVLHDVGRVINPALLHGQLAGAAAQGIGSVLLEELMYDEQGQPLSTSFADYLLPTSGELPRIETVVMEKPTSANPLGIKGGGESGMVGTPAAVANAVADALGIGTAELPATPLTPDRIRAFLRGRGRDAAR